MGHIERDQSRRCSVVEQMAPELWGESAMRHEGAYASSSEAVRAAMAGIEAHRHDGEGVLGFEGFKKLPGGQTSQNQNAAPCAGHEKIDCKFTWSAAFGRLTLEHKWRFGLDRTYLICITELSRQDCVEITDRACARVVASSCFAHAYTQGFGFLREKWPCIARCGHRHSSMHLKSKLTRSAHKRDVFAHGRDTIAVTWRRARDSGAESIQGMQARSCWTSTEYRVMDHLRPAVAVQSRQAVADRSIAASGRRPINISIGSGHQVCATSMRMLFDVVKQVTGQSGGCQMEGALRIQIRNIGGSCASVLSFGVECHD